MKIKSEKKSYSSPALIYSFAEKKFTAHSYFSNTLRDIVANNDSVVVIPESSIELFLRKKMFDIYKKDGIRSSKHYEQRLKALLKEETITKDQLIYRGISKRYLKHKSSK